MSLHGLLKFNSKAKVFQVWNGVSKNLFLVLIIVTMQGHKFEIYPMVSEIHDNADLVLAVNHFIELKTDLSMRGLIFKFLNKSVPVFHVYNKMVTSRERTFLKVEAKFLNELQG